MSCHALLAVLGSGRAMGLVPPLDILSHGNVIPGDGGTEDERAWEGEGHGDILL